jgi:hypothetical protein
MFNPVAVDKSIEKKELTDLHSGNMQFVDGDRRHENSSPIVIAG